MTRFLLAFLFLPTVAHAEFASRSAAVLDANLDGKPDVVVGTEGGLYVFSGLGAGKFDIGQRLPTGSATYDSMDVRDMDGDGSPDLLVAGTSSLGVWSASKEGLRRRLTGAHDLILWNAVAADLNGDKVPEVVLSTSDMVHVLERRGDSFELAYRIQPPVSGSQVCRGDVNGDGRDDLCYALTGNPKVWLLLGQPKGKPRPSTVLLGKAASYPTLADFNGDGRLDIAAAWDHGASVVFGKGDGTFSSPTLTDTGSETLCQGSIAVDLDRDGKADFVPCDWQSNSLQVFPAGLGPARSLAEGLRTLNHAAGDYDGDGKVDLLACTRHGLQLLHNRGDGTFETGPLLKR